jgi:hypothetical protein
MIKPCGPQKLPLQITRAAFKRCGFSLARHLERFLFLWNGKEVNRWN